MPDASKVNALTATDINSFKLNSPASGIQVDVDLDLTAPIVIKWDTVKASNNSLVTYKWQAVLATTATFATPLLNLVSDNAGKNPSLTFTPQDLHNALGTLGVAIGSTADLKWNVEVTTSTGLKKMANTAFNVKLFRKPQFPSVMRLIGGGSSAGWNPPTSIPMKKIAEGKFEIYAYLDGEFKFVPTSANYDGDWGIKSGTANNNLTGVSQLNGATGDKLDGHTGLTGELVQDGESNISIPSAGFYRVTLDFTTTPKKLEVVKVDWGIIGSATPGGWGGTTAMSLQSVSPGVVKGSYTWKITANLAGGQEMKFRSTVGWAINFGGTTTNLTYGGANIPVATNGTYTVTLVLDPSGNYTYSVTP